MAELGFEYGFIQLFLIAEMFNQLTLFNSGRLCNIRQ